jgi:uncharacterized membrane protein
MSKETIRQLLLTEHGIKMRFVNVFILCCQSLTIEFASPATITRRKCKLDLKGSSATTKSIPDVVKRQLVVDQMAKDPTRMQGPRIVKEGIMFDTGQNISRHVAEIYDI